METETVAGGPTVTTPDPDCTNCDGRGCMGCVLRWYDHECRDDCPFCCKPDYLAEPPTLMTRGPAD